MDILFGNLKLSESKLSSVEDDKAPLELMSDFLVLVAASKMKEALKVCHEILQFEPNNKMMQEYKVSLTEYIKQGWDDPPSPESSEGEEDDDGEGDNSEGDNSSSEDSDDEDHYKVGSSKPVPRPSSQALNNKVNRK